MDSDRVSEKRLKVVVPNENMPLHRKNEPSWRELTQSTGWGLGIKLSMIASSAFGCGTIGATIYHLVGEDTFIVPLLNQTVGVVTMELSGGCAALGAVVAGALWCAARQYNVESRAEEGDNEESDRSYEEVTQTSIPVSYDGTFEDLNDNELGDPERTNPIHHKNGDSNFEGKHTESSQQVSLETHSKSENVPLSETEETNNRLQGSINTNTRIVSASETMSEVAFSFIDTDAEESLGTVISKAEAKRKGAEPLPISQNSSTHSGEGGATLESMPTTLNIPLSEIAQHKKEDKDEDESSSFSDGTPRTHRRLWEQVEAGVNLSNQVSTNPHLLNLNSEAGVGSESPIHQSSISQLVSTGDIDILELEHEVRNSGVNTVARIENTEKGLADLRHPWDPSSTSSVNSNFESSKGERGKKDKKSERNARQSKRNDASNSERSSKGSIDEERVTKSDSEKRSDRRKTSHRSEKPGSNSPEVRHHRSRSFAAENSSRGNSRSSSRSRDGSASQSADENTDIFSHDFDNLQNVLKGSHGSKDSNRVTQSSTRTRRGSESKSKEASTDLSNQDLDDLSSILNRLPNAKTKGNSGRT